MPNRRRTTQTPRAIRDIDRSAARQLATADRKKSAALHKIDQKYAGRLADLRFAPPGKRKALRAAELSKIRSEKNAALEAFKSSRSSILKRRSEAKENTRIILGFLKKAGQKDVAQRGSLREVYARANGLAGVPNQPGLALFPEVPGRAEAGFQGIYKTIPYTKSALNSLIASAKKAYVVTQINGKKPAFISYQVNIDISAQGRNFSKAVTVNTLLNSYSVKSIFNQIEKILEQYKIRGPGNNKKEKTEIKLQVYLKMTKECQDTFRMSALKSILKKGMRFSGFKAV